jgi:hypothetical protein
LLGELVSMSWLSSEWNDLRKAAGGVLTSTLDAQVSIC